MNPPPQNTLSFKQALLAFPEDSGDCLGSQKKDESNDKEKKEEEEAAASVHHSIIETWDWGRQPGMGGCSSRRAVSLPAGF